MIKNRYFFSMLLLVSLIFPFAGCEPVTDDGSPVAPITLYEKVGGVWNLSDMRQIDETAKVAGLSTVEINLYAQFEFGTFSIDLKTENNLPISYQVSGNAPELFPNSGYWQLDTEFTNADGTPPKILLYSDAGKTVQTGQISITSIIPGDPDVMELQLTRTSNGVPFVSYIFKLTK